MHTYSICFPLYSNGPLKVTKPSLLTKWSRQIILNIVTQPLYQQWSSTSRWTTVVCFYPVLFCSSMQASYWQAGEWVLLMCFLDEIQTMLPQLANQPSRVLPADMFTDHLSKTKDWWFWEKSKKGNWRRDSFSLLYCILVIHKVVDFMSLFGIWLAYFSFKQFPP